MDFCEVINNEEVISLIFKVLALAIMLVAAALDIREKKIPLSIPAIQMTLSLLYFLYLWNKKMDDPRGLVLSLIPGALLLAISYLTKQGVGLGDGLMVLSLGPLFGIADMVLVATIAFTLSAIVGSVLLILRKAGRKSVMAFMPFLTVGVGVMSFAIF